VILCPLLLPISLRLKSPSPRRILLPCSAMRPSLDVVFFRVVRARVFSSPLSSRPAPLPLNPTGLAGVASPLSSPEIPVDSSRFPFVWCLPLRLFRRTRNVDEKLSPYPFFSQPLSRDLCVPEPRTRFWPLRSLRSDTVPRVLEIPCLAFDLTVLQISNSVLDVVFYQVEG